MTGRAPCIGLRPARRAARRLSAMRPATLANLQAQRAESADSHVPTAAARAEVRLLGPNRKTPCRAAVCWPRMDHATGRVLSEHAISVRREEGRNAQRAPRWFVAAMAVLVGAGFAFGRVAVAELA